MKHRFLLALFAASMISAPVMADPLPDGRYAGEGGGQRLEMIVAGRNATIRVAASGCLGETSGSFRDAGSGQWLFTSPTTGGGMCEIGLIRNGDGSITVNEQSGCSFWHGMSCGFSGRVSR